MANGKYGDFRYGEAYYGGSSDNYLWAFLFDWDGDGEYDENNESDYAIDFRCSRGRRQYIREGGEGIEDIDIGRCTITFNNRDERFNPYYSGSSLYPNVKPGKFAKVQVTHSGTPYDIFAGVVQDIINNGYRTTCDFIIEDGMRWLADTSTNTEVQTSIGTHTAISTILTNVNWPSIWGSTVNTGAETLNYWWASDDRNALQEISDLVNSEVGIFFIDASGQFVFRPRSHSYSPEMTVDESEVLIQINLPQPWTFKRTIIEVPVSARTAGSTTTIWELDETPAISAGGSFEVMANYDDPSANVITPVATTDYTANTDSGGGGVDITSDISVSIAKYGTKSRLIYTNNGASNGYLTFAQLRGDPIVLSENIGITEKADDHASYPKRLKMDYSWIESSSTAQDYADFLVGYLSGYNPFPIIRIENRPSIQFALDIDDIITFESSTLGISGDFRIGGIEHAWKHETGQSVVSTFYLEPYFSSAHLWKFPTLIGETSIFGW